MKLVHKILFLSVQIVFQNALLKVFQCVETLWLRGASPLDPHQGAALDPPGALERAPGPHAAMRDTPVASLPTFAKSPWLVSHKLGISVNKQINK